MTQTIPAKDITLKELKNLFSLQLIQDEQFFWEWQEDLPSLTDLQKQLLNEVKEGFLNLRESSPMLESLIRLAILGPLLFIGKFYQSPFYIKAEYSVDITTEDEGVIVRGNIDFLLLKQELWIAAIESKKGGYSLEVALEQLLAYMLAASHPEKPVYGMITNGGEFMFVKLTREDSPKYATSAQFAIRNPGNDLYKILQILGRFSQLVD